MRDRGIASSNLTRYQVQHGTVGKRSGLAYSILVASRLFLLLIQRSVLVASSLGSLFFARVRCRRFYCATRSLARLARRAFALFFFPLARSRRSW